MRTTITISASILVLWLLFLSGFGARAQEPAPAAPPKTILFVTAGFSYDDLRPAGRMRDVRLLANSGAVALLNPAVAKQATVAAAALTVGAGMPLSAPGRFGPKIYESGVPRSVEDIATEAFTLMAAPDDPSRQTYLRRMGVPVPETASIVDIGLPTLLQNQVSPTAAARVGELGNTLARAGVRVAVYGDWPAMLVGMDRSGAVSAGEIGVPLNPKFLAGTLRDGDVIIVSIAGRTALKAFARAAAPLARHGLANVIFADIAPVRTKSGSAWARLGWVIAAGPAFPAGSILTSPTTRTPGLIANVDLAPTVLALRGIAPPLGGSGRAAVAVPARAPWAVLDRLDDQTLAMTKSATAVMATFAALGILSGLLALAGLHFGLRWAGSLAWAGLLIAAAMFLALLVSGVAAPLSIRTFVALTVGVAVLVAGLAALIGWRTGLSPIGLIFAALTLVLLIDCFCGGYCAQRSVDNFLPGIRYYGIGNENLGAAIGAGLVAVGLLRLPRAVAFCLFGLLIFGIGLPMCGANSGGVLVATVGFALALVALGGRPLRPATILLAFALGIALTAAFAWADSLRSPAAQSHMGVAVAAGEANGPRVWAEIALRKLGMSARIALDHRTLLALVALLPLGWLLVTGRLGARARAAIAARPGLERALPACGWAAVAAICFKDSGVVAALILLACPTAAVLIALLEDAGAALVP